MAVLYHEAGRGGPEKGMREASVGSSQTSFLPLCTSLRYPNSPCTRSFPQAPGDTELSLCDSEEEDGPSYWDLERVSRGARGRGEREEDLLLQKMFAACPLQFRAAT